jgi:branched-chain amino acid transport system substrate-binding protein
LKAIKFQGIAYANPVEWSDKGDNLSAVIFVNKVSGDKFEEIDQIGR